ncbi:MAG: MBL fold metallo-hydrolase [Phycisphaeraceae bacterium]
MALELLFLGTGTSAGVPMIGCDCPVCTSDDPRDRRHRCSVLVSHPAEPGDDVDRRQWLIDTSPELRMQAIDHGIARLDGVLFTHAHADHIFGLDDLRRFNAVMGTPLDIYAERRVLDQLGRMFPYIFQPQGNVNKSFIPTLLPQEIHAGRPLDLPGAEWTPLRLMHGRLPILGYRVDRGGCSLAYCTDVSRIEPETLEQLQGLDLLVIDALRYRHHPTHMTVDQALDVVDHLAPKRALLTHIAHDILHADLAERLPEGVELAWDGLKVVLEEEAGEVASTDPDHQEA